MEPLALRQRRGLLLGPRAPQLAAVLLAPAWRWGPETTASEEGPGGEEGGGEEEHGDEGHSPEGEDGNGRGPAAVIFWQLISACEKGRGAAIRLSACEKGRRCRQRAHSLPRPEWADLVRWVLRMGQPWLRGY